MKWVEFDKATGRIGQSVSGSSLVPPDETDTLGRLDGSGWIDGNVFYVVMPARTVAARPPTTITAAQAGNVVTLANVAVGTGVTVSGDASVTIEQDDVDGGLQLTFPNPGSYTISAEQFPELPFELTITV